MAYLDVSALAASTAEQFHHASPWSPAAFDRREWEIVMLARRDSLASLRDPNRVERLSARLFGGHINRHLADPRLEALRQMAVLAWRYEHAVPVSAIASFTAAGFSTGQLELLVAHVVADQTNSGRSAHA